ncbi:hypothetical protein GJ496_011312 [Pomphorhynchus laevis]|nr:hypothetical protein GJ496_011312 [Pomphorhynchus laevis]
MEGQSYCCKIFQQQGIETQAIQQQCLGTQATGLIPSKCDNLINQQVKLLYPIEKEKYIIKLKFEYSEEHDVWKSYIHRQRKLTKKQIVFRYIKDRIVHTILSFTYLEWNKKYIRMLRENKIEVQDMSPKITGLLKMIHDYVGKEEIGEFCEGATCHMVRMCKDIGNDYKECIINGELENMVYLQGSRPEPGRQQIKLLIFDKEQALRRFPQCYKCQKWGTFPVCATRLKNVYIVQGNMSPHNVMIETSLNVQIAVDTTKHTRKNVQHYNNTYKEFNKEIIMDLKNGKQIHMQQGHEETWK